MSGHNARQESFQGSDGTDPGDAGTILVDRNPHVVALVSTAAQTRTLARPTRAGIECCLFFMTDGGDITLTVTGGLNENGDTTFTFSDPGQFVIFRSIRDSSSTFVWRKVADYSTGNLAPGLTATVTELNRLDDDNAVLATLAGAGITTGTGTIYKTSVLKIGSIYYSNIYIDLTGLAAVATDLDIIGVGASPAHLGQITTARNGTIEAVRMTCLEAPAGASADIDLYSANEATGILDGGIAALVETAVITAGGAWTNGAVKGATTVPPANDYLYLTNGAAANAGTYTAGKFLLEIIGY